MRSSILAIALLAAALGTSLFSLREFAQTAQASLVDVRTPIEHRFPVQFTNPCALPDPPWWCFGEQINIKDLIGPDPGPCVCPDVVVPENLGVNETIVIETIPGRISDTLVISKQLNPQSLPPGEANITLNR
jgi:hypothetical protein